MDLPLAVLHRTTGPAVVARAAAAGANAYELDVRLVGDVVRVGHHRRLPWPGWLEHDDLRLRRTSAAGRDPTLAEVLADLPRGADVVLDLKDDRGGGDRLVERLAETTVSTDRRTYVTGHAWADLTRAQELTGWTPLYTVASARQLPGLAPALPDGPRGLSVRHTLLGPRTVDRLRALTGLLLAWTVQDEARAAFLLDLGVTGIVTDSVGVLRRVSER